MENETNFKQYLLLLLKWKKLIIGLTVLVILISGILNYLILKPIYRGSASVYIAQIYNNLLLKAKDAQSQITSEAFIQKIAQDLGVESTSISNALSVSTAQDSKILLVNFDSKDKELIKSFFKYFIIELNNFNNEAYYNQINAIKNQALVLQGEVDSLNKQAEEVLAKLKTLDQKGATSSEYVLEYSQLRGVYDSILSKSTGLISQISSLQSAVSSANLFFYQSEPLIIDTPIKPHKLFNTAISALIVFCLSILGVFFFEYWKGN